MIAPVVSFDVGLDDCSCCVGFCSIRLRRMEIEDFSSLQSWGLIFLVRYVECAHA